LIIRPRPTPYKARKKQRKILNKKILRDKIEKKYNNKDLKQTIKRI